jgi:Mor family transcriptional regulator
MFTKLLELSADLPPHPARAGLLAALALDLSNSISQDFGGNGLYIHKAVSFHLSKRNLEMFELYDNQRWTYKSLGLKFGMSEVHARNIIQACLEDELKRRQGRLPGLDDPQ